MLPFFIKACSLALSDYPIVNCHIDEDVDKNGYIQRYVLKKDHNFSVALDSPMGLVVPVVKAVQTKSILAISNELKTFQDKAKESKFVASDFANGTFSISSVGNIGGKYFVPTILPPQGSIIALGKAYKKAEYVEDESKPEGYRWDPIDTINFSISADHRVIDGATIARFSQRMKHLVENPNLMLLNMS